MKNFLKTEYLKINSIYTDLDKKFFIILLSIPIISTISWYFASRSFFKENIYNVLIDSELNLELLEILYWLITDSAACLLIPLIILFILKEKISEYGLKLGDFNIGLKYLILSAIIILPIIWIISSFDDFINYYPTITETKNNLKLLIIYQSVLFIYLFAWEFLWRGYFLFSLEKKIGLYSIFVQVIPFVLLHNGKPVLETFSALAGGIFLGYIAIRTRSFLYGVLIHYLLMFCIEIMSILRYQNNEYGIGFNAIINILM